MSSTVSAVSGRMRTAVIGDTKKADNGTSVNKDMSQTSFQSTMVGEDEWIEMNPSSKVHQCL